MFYGALNKSDYDYDYDYGMDGRLYRRTRVLGGLPTHPVVDLPDI